LATGAVAGDEAVGDVVGVPVFVPSGDSFDGVRARHPIAQNITRRSVVRRKLGWIMVHISNQQLFTISLPFVQRSHHLMMV
jgi:hypothetical protein